MKDCDVIDAFLAHLHGLGYPVLEVDRWPDKDNRTTSDIDAIAGPFAIEHTSIDTLINQRRDSDWFMRAVGGLDIEIGASLSCRLRIYVDYHAVKKGQNWEEVRAALKEWAINETPELPEGRSLVANVPGVPFTLTVFKESSREPSIGFARSEPSDSTLPQRIRGAFERKAEKLKKYQDRYETILLVENEDIALMDDLKMRKSIKIAFPDALPPEIDQVWYADTSIDGQIRFLELASKPQQTSS